MRCARKRTLLTAGVLIAAVSCSSTAPLSDNELAECTAIASGEGTIGGSASVISTLVLRLPDEVGSTEGASADEAEVVFNAAFNQMYGISVDQFLVLRDDADVTTTAEYGESPSVGERVPDEWFTKRDALMMALWNERYPASARMLCDVVMVATERAP